MSEPWTKDKIQQVRKINDMLFRLAMDKFKRCDETIGILGNTKELMVKFIDEFERMQEKLKSTITLHADDEPQAFMGPEELQP